ncbi:MAG: quinohemoprotein amine dehydrogenase subunit beta [Caenispirillum sp.]|nr:quinohemoprotein amine dehydrogenase subunit beta [Caenispirillum sp.]
MKTLHKTLLTAAAGLALVGLAGGEASAKEYLLTAAKPNKVVLIDPAARAVEKVVDIPGPGVAPWTVMPSPDGKIAYVLTAHNEAVVGVDIDTGKEVFRTDMNEPENVRSKIMPAVELSRDGKELFVFVSPMKELPGEYQVMDTRVKVFSTADGVGAKPVREFEVPRRIALFFMSADDQTLWGLGWDLYGIDPKTGAIKETHKIVNGPKPDRAPADILDFWPQYEQADVFSTPYYTFDTTKQADDPTAYKTGMLTLDLKSGEFVMDEFEDTSAVIFSSVVNPVRRNEVFSTYTQLSKIDTATDTLVKRVDLPHTYYSINISGDGEEVYVAGTMCDIGIYSTADLSEKGRVEIPGCPDQGVASLRVIER